MKKLLVIIFILFASNSWGADLTGTIQTGDGTAVTGISIYVYAYALTGSGSSTQIDALTYAGTTASSSVDGTWTITGLDAATYYMVLFVFGGTYKGNTELAGAEFLLTP